MSDSPSCLHCGEQLPDPNANFCSHCGKPHKVRCENCGQESASGNYCSNCGFTLTSGLSPADHEGAESEIDDPQVLEKRLQVYKNMLEAKVDRIKTEEDFRKFRMEVDRDRVLDQAEWKQFKDELLWKDDDAQRDRRFLVRKIELQQESDLKRLEVLNNKETEIKAALKDLELEKLRTEQELEIEGRKEEALRKKALLDIEIKQKKSEMGMAALERMKSIRRNNQREQDFHQMEMSEREMELRLREDKAKHKLKQESVQEETLKDTEKADQE